MCVSRFHKQVAVYDSHRQTPSFVSAEPGVSANKPVFHSPALLTPQPPSARAPAGRDFRKHALGTRPVAEWIALCEKLQRSPERVALFSSALRTCGGINWLVGRSVERERERASGRYRRNSSRTCATWMFVLALPFTSLSSRRREARRETVCGNRQEFIPRGDFAPEIRSARRRR